jgi:hypothetical protein
MVIVWGTKIKTYNMGLVADYCPICREPKAFQLKEYCEAGHLYYISLTHGKPFKYTVVCETCGVERAPSTGLTTKALKTNRNLSIDDLIMKTFPDLEQKKRKIIERNERLKNDPQSFTPDERVKLIQEPFVVMATGVSEQQEGSSHRQTHPMTLLGGVATIAFIVAALVFFAKWADRNATIHLVGAIVSLAGAAGTGVVAFMGERMGIRKRYYPMLIRAYLPLKPSLQELREGIGSFPSKLAKKVKADQLFEEMQVQSRIQRR